MCGVQQILPELILLYSSLSFHLAVMSVKSSIESYADP